MDLPSDKLEREEAVQADCEQVRLREGLKNSSLVN